MAVVAGGGVAGGGGVNQKSFESRNFGCKMAYFERNFN